jgi:hypothetical protein
VHRHVKEKHKNNAKGWWLCEEGLCGGRFGSCGELLRHALAVHGVTQPLRCWLLGGDGNQRCGYSTNQEDRFKQHVNGKHGNSSSRSFICSICQIPLKSKQALDNHLITIHAPSPAPANNPRTSQMTCGVCGIEVQQQSMRRHMETHAPPQAGKKKNAKYRRSSDQVFFD